MQLATERLDQGLAGLAAILQMLCEMLDRGLGVASLDHVEAHNTSPSRNASVACQGAGTCDEE